VIISRGVKLFEHWKAAGDGIKASALALSIGQSFDQLGLHAQKIQLYEDALELWTGSSSGSKEFGGIRNSVMDSLSVAELEYVSKLVKALSDAHAQYDYSGKNVSGTRAHTNKDDIKIEV